LEWERDIESFNHFAEPIHITEMDFPCSTPHFPEQGKYAYWGGDKGGEAMTWHDEGTQTVPGDWIESVDTIAYSKSWVEAISCWNFNRKCHDGFVTTERTARESYHRLQAL
jgi:hypothetical protein